MKDKFLNVIKLLRVEQWIKNMFIFVPILFFDNISNIEKSIIAFTSFCFISSCACVLNDIVDKGKIWGTNMKVKLFKTIVLALILATISFIIAFSLNNYILLIIILYLLNNLFYSFKIKHMIILDVFSKAIDFILRILTGSFAIGSEISSWMILCILFLALFLGFCKERNELIIKERYSKELSENLLKYNEKLLDQIINIILTCTIIFYAIYSVIGISDGNFIWTTILVLFGILRYYYLIYSKDEGGNTMDLILKDRQLAFCIIFWITVYVSIKI
ncbi:4-hydroxybenzoate polyprenyltransferase [Clostridium cavendishii DSM 21758]|uniref:4-hydroxybenzoate polyprenyltransferase n=1 Tax=Clostridium cavendishii DSM 21758 TaxID=1121302 RepID=A0A1M6UN46_9CLOT|nr:decaprenyl-phosphate phosphoribosyltransferase [Clostridium cavendishii]SHK70576.1 4-hydroxybenzoate polyprenyltransferase [Clostridium cavendishii DSM 21758]